MIDARVVAGAASIALATAWRQEDGAAQIDVEHAVEIFRLEVEQVAAHRRRRCRHC